MATGNECDLSLRRLRADEFPDYRATFIHDWAADLARAEGCPAADAIRQATRRTDASLPDGVATPGHYLFAIMHGDQRVGTMWFSIEAEADPRWAFLDDITIDAGFRRRGYGRRALERMEESAKQLGAVGIKLHVYQDNPGAIGLYQALGYRATGVNMRKSLE